MSVADLVDIDLTQEVEQQAQTQQVLAALAYRVFRQSDDGAKLLARLHEQFIGQPVVMADSTQFAAGIREGQNSMVRYIEWLCREHEQAHNLEGAAE